MNVISTSLFYCLEIVVIDSLIDFNSISTYLGLFDT